MAHDGGMEGSRPAAVLVPPQGRVLSLDAPRRTQLPCWLAAAALHCAAIAIVAFHDPMPDTPPAPVAIEIVMLDSPNDASPPAVAEPPEPVAETEPPPSSSAPPAPPEAAAIEPDVPEPVVEDRPEPEPPVVVVVAEALPPPPPPRPRSISPPPREAPAVDAAPAAAPRLAESSPAAVEMVVPPAPARRPAESDYVRTLLGWLERYKEYPRAARMRRIEGQVALELSIAADGQIAFVKVLTSSGHPTLDDAALEMVRRAAPVPRPQGGPIHLAIPVVFALGAR